MMIVEIVDELDSSAARPEPNRTEKILEKLRKYEQEQSRSGGTFANEKAEAGADICEPTADGSVDIDFDDAE